MAPATVSPAGGGERQQNLSGLLDLKPAVALSNGSLRWAKASPFPALPEGDPGVARVEAKTDEAYVEVKEVSPGKSWKVDIGEVSAEKLALSPDGHQLAVIAGYALILFDVEQNKRIAVLQESDADRLLLLKSLAFSPNGNTLACGGPQRIVFWSGLRKNGPLADWTEKNFEWHRMELSVDGDAEQLAVNDEGDSFVTGIGPLGVTVWRWEGWNQLAAAAYIPTEDPFAVAFDADGQTVSVVRSVERQEVGERYCIGWACESFDETGYATAATIGYPTKILGLRFSPGGEALSVIAEGGYKDQNVIRQWESSGGKELATNNSFTIPRSDDAMISEDGLLVATGFMNDRVRVWDVSERKELSVPQEDPTPAGLENFVTVILLPPGGNYLAVGYRKGFGKTFSGSLVIYARDGDAFVKKGRLTLSGHEKVFKLSPDGNYLVYVEAVAGEQYGKAHLVDVNSGKDDSERLGAYRLAGYATPYTPPEFTFSPNGKYLAVCYATIDKSYVIYNASDIWRTSDWSKVKTFEHRAEITSVSFGPRESYVVSVSHDGEMKLADLSNSSRRVQTLNLGWGISKVLIDPRELTVAVANFDTVRVIDLATAQEVDTIATSDFSIAALAFSDDGKYLATGSDLPKERFGAESSTMPYYVRVWPLRQDELLREASRRLASLGR